MKLLRTRYRLPHLLWGAVAALGFAVGLRAAPLTTLEYRITGTQLRVSPAVLSVPKGIAGSVLVQLVSGGSTNGAAASALAESAYIEATLRGPSFAARRLVGQLNSALLLPPLNLVGDYQLDNIRLVDGATGETKMEGTPSSVPVRVFDEVLVSRVTSRPLTLAEIQDRGIVIDDANFRVVEFTVGFVLDGKLIPVRFPVVAPTFSQSTEIIPQAELEKRLAEAAILNQQIAGTVELPPELEQSQLNLQITGINFQQVDVGEQDLELRIPPIPALMVIPGNIGFLNQFFSVQIFTENAAPGGSGLSANNIQARLILPPGPDRIASTNYNQPGDDPLRFARIGPDKIIQATQAVVRPGPDGKIATADDILRLQPGESGTGEFLVEGLQEGLHVMDLDLFADLEGLAAGVVKIQGKAAGSVLVRNPKFSLAFTHPRTVRSGEPYEASVTILNTSISPANLVRVTLPGTSLSGGVLESAETVELGTILPGQSATAQFRIRSQRTGAISFSNLTTSDDSTQGHFRLSMGIDERGVILSPDTLAMPDFVNSLPTNLLTAANRVLGQALSVATAGQLPPGVTKVPKSIITKRVLELAEAGQRLRYGDSLQRVLADLLLDWQGGRSFNAGLDQILRVTDAGREFREALMAEMESVDTLDGVGRLAERAPDLTGRGESWALAGVDVSGVELSFNDGTNSAQLSRSDAIRALGYFGARGHWLVVGASSSNAVFKWTVTNALPSAQFAALLINTNGTARQFRWTVAIPAPGSCFSFAIGDASGLLLADSDCDGLPESSLPATTQNITELPPELVAARQDPSVHAGRPVIPCSPLPYDPRNYGTVLAVLFSKSMTQGGVNVPAAYALENGNRANSVQIQPGARVALLNMAQPVGALRPRTMNVTGVTDPRGNAVTANSKSVTNGLVAGTAIRGRVVRADGSFAAAVPVTLTYYDREAVGFNCVSFTVRASQVFTDADGFFSFDFVLSGIPYLVSATDTANLPPEAVALLLESASGDAFARQKLFDLANVQTNLNTILNAFNSASLPQAIAQAEGLDRAVLRDLIPLGSAREGTETVVALRFRGRGVVSGTVFSADGVTPVSGVAVNLFPDPDSRELGRGLFSDSNGRFAFFGVPLGLFTVQATAPSGQFRTVAGVLDEVGETLDLPIVLSSNVTTRAALRGRVFEPDTVTPHPSARVFVGQFNDNTGKFENVVAAVTADNDGFWVATNFPAGTYDVAAVSFDGRRKGDRRRIQATLAGDTLVSITLNGRTTVFGRVEFFDGRAATNALVAGGDTIVRTDNDGLFTLTGVPTGNRSISAGVERNTNAVPPIDFPRLGSASLNVVAGVDNFVVVRLRPAGRIKGRVLDALGQFVPNARVAIPQQDGFVWVDADAQGNYLFENLTLDEYTLSAPGPEVAQTDTSGLIDRIRGGTSGEIEAALGEALRIFSGATDPFLTGEPFNPVTWGFTRTRLTFDGQTANADILLLRPGTVAGKVLNGQGVPIGARVRLTGIGPLANGAPSFVVRGDANSDPALGTFEFPNGILVGPFGLQAASPFFPAVISTNGQTTSTEPNSTNNILQFPPTRETIGRLTGIVFYPDGSRVGSNVTVKINLSSDYSITTDTNGVFDTGNILPAPRGYTVIAEDPLTGFKGQCLVSVQPGVTNVCNVQLIGKGAIIVTVSQANGSPAINATVEIRQGAFPNDQFTGNTGTNGTLSFQNIFAGSYAVSAAQISGPTTIFGRGGTTVVAGLTSVVTVVLGPTATIRGTFLKRDLITPIGFAQVAVGNIGFTTTDAIGKFDVAGIPLGNYRLVSQDPVTGIGAIANVTLTFDGQTNEVLLVEQARGEIVGHVINGYGTAFVPGASVSLKVNDGLTSERAVTTGTDGGFSFPGTPAGGFTLEAEDPVTKFRGLNSGTLAESVATLQADVQLQPLARLAGTVFEPDGVTPVINAAVRLTGPVGFVSTDTDSTGRVAFVDLPLGDYTLRADSRRATHSAGTTNVTLNIVGNAPDFALVLRGVGEVNGTVFLSDATTPAVGAEVILKSQAPLFNGLEEPPRFADAFGQFLFTNVAVGPYTLSVKSVALGASAGGSIVTNGETDTVTLVLGASGSVIGRLVRADGSNAAPGIDVVLLFNSQSGLPGVAVSRTDGAGAFSFANIPVGSFDFEAIALGFDGIANFTSAITSNGQTNDLGDVRLDEDDPFVASVDPPHTAVGVPITTAVTLTFNEPLDAETLGTNGIYLRTGASATPATLQLLPDPTNGLLRVVRLTPLTPLLSEETYEVVVIDGDRFNATGGLIASGPTDLVGRPLPVPFVSRFTTADGDPPVIISQFPSNNAVQIDVRSVPRLSFNESVSPTNFTFTLTGPAGAVAGAASVGLNGLVMTFTPAAALDPNASYTWAVSGVRDLAGNLALNQPITATFATLDTHGPVIATLRIASNAPPVAGATIFVEALLATNEAGTSVRFEQDFNLVGKDTNAPYLAPIIVPLTGSTTVRATASDRFGNVGELAELVVSPLSNQPPVISLTRAQPPTGPLANGQNFSLAVSATDDAAVTNVTVVGIGALNFFTNLPNGNPRVLSFTVPSNAVPGSLFQFRAQATDFAGLTSPEATLDIAVTDASAPAVTILSPAPNAVLNSAFGLALAVALSDNSTNYQLEVTLSGSVLATQTLAVVNAANVTMTNLFTFPLSNSPPDGGSVVATVKATDANTNMTTVSRTFVLPDARPPQLASVNPANGAPRQSLWPSALIFDFDEEIDPATATTSNVIATNNAGVATAFTVALANAGRQLRITPGRALLPGVTYTNTLLPGFADASSNAWQNIGGGPVPAEGVAFTFTTANVLAVTPTNGTSVTAGQNLTVTVNYEPGLGASFFRFQINGGAATQISAGVSNVSAVLTVPLVGGDAVINIAASDNAGFTEPFALPPLTIHVLADTRPPELLTASPTNAALRQSLWLTSVFDFDEALSPATVTTNTVTLTNNAGAATSLNVNLVNGNQRVIIAPARPLRPGVTYTNTLLPGLADLSGNGWRNIGGDAVPAEGAPFTFTTAAILNVAPTNGATVFAAQAVNATVNFEPGLGANFFRFEISGSSPVTVAAGNTNASALLFAPASSPQAVINVTASPDAAFAEALVFAPVTVNVLPLIGDLDGDGIPDDEDPDIDGDALANTDEAIRGTNPRNPDTDGDAWRDGAEVEIGSNPLLAASVPILFHVAQPEVGLILPTLIPSGDVTNGLTVAQPEVGLILPAFAEFAELTNGVTVGQPEVGLILPAFAEFAELTNGITVGQPEVGLILPGFQLTEVTDGVTVAQPEVGLILPASPDFSSLTPGLTVAEPVVVLRLDVSARSESVTPRTQGLVLRLAQLETAPEVAAAAPSTLIPALNRPKVVLEWTGPARGTYTIEASTNLQTWMAVPMEPLTSVNGTFRVRCDVGAPAAMFYRLRHAP